MLGGIDVDLIHYIVYVITANEFNVLSYKKILQSEFYDAFDFVKEIYAGTIKDSNVLEQYGELSLREFTVKYREFLRQKLPQLKKRINSVEAREIQNFIILKSSELSMLKNESQRLESQKQKIDSKIANIEKEIEFAKRDLVANNSSEEASQSGFGDK